MTSLSSARSALDAGSSQVARTAFLAVADETADPLAYEGLAQAAWWLDEGETCVGSRATAYRRHRELGDSLGAARAATGLAWDSPLFGHGEAVALGWWRRAESLLDGLKESPEHGWHAVREAELAMEVSHDPDRALAAGIRASAIARRLDLGDLEVVGLALQGLAMTSAGDVEGGMARAICAERALAPLFNVCRIQYASVQVARGSWREAERELAGVLERLSGSRRTSRLEAVVQLGELRRRQGRYDEAEALFAQAEFHPSAIAGRARSTCPAVNYAVAWTAIRLLQWTAAGQPPPPLLRADVLYLAVVVAHAAQARRRAARLLAGELRETATPTLPPAARVAAQNSSGSHARWR